MSHTKSLNCMDSPKIIVTQDPVKSSRHFRLTVLASDKEPTIHERDALSEVVRARFETDDLFVCHGVPPRDSYRFYDHETDSYYTTNSRYKIDVIARANPSMDIWTLASRLTGFEDGQGNMTIEGNPQAFKFTILPSTYCDRFMYPSSRDIRRPMTVDFELHNHTSQLWIKLPIAECGNYITFRGQVHTRFNADYTPNTGPLVDILPGTSETVSITWT